MFRVWRTIKGEGSLLYLTDVEIRKLGEQMGLETPVVLAVKDGYYLLNK